MIHDPLITTDWNLLSVQVMKHTSLISSAISVGKPTTGSLLRPIILQWDREKKHPFSIKLPNDKSLSLSSVLNLGTDFYQLQRKATHIHDYSARNLLTNRGPQNQWCQHQPMSPLHCEALQSDQDYSQKPPLQENDWHFSKMHYSETWPERTSWKKMSLH